MMKKVIALFRAKARNLEGDRQMLAINIEEYRKKYRDTMRLLIKGNGLDGDVTVSLASEAGKEYSHLRYLLLSNGMESCAGRLVVENRDSLDMPALVAFESDKKDKDGKPVLRNVFGNTNMANPRFDIYDYFDKCVVPYVSAVTADTERASA